MITKSEKEALLALVNATRSAELLGAVMIADGQSYMDVADELWRELRRYIEEELS